MMNSVEADCSGRSLYSYYKLYTTDVWRRSSTFGSHLGHGGVKGLQHLGGLVCLWHTRLSIEEAAATVGSEGNKELLWYTIRTLFNLMHPTSPAIPHVSCGALMKVVSPCRFQSVSGGDMSVTTGLALNRVSGSQWTL